MPSHLILRCQSEDVVYWEEAKKTPHSRMPDSGSRTVCRHYLRGLCMKGGVRGIFQYFPQMVARWLKAQVSSDSGYQLWGTMFCLPINHSGLANFDSHPLILVNESLELLQTYGLTSFFMVGLHEKSIYRYIYIYICIYHLLQARPRFHPTSWTPTCVPCVFTRRNRWQVWVSTSIWSKSNARMYHLSQGHDPPAGFCHGFFVGDLGDLQYENHRWWVVTRYNKSDVSRHSDVSLLFSCTALNIARHEPLLEANHVFYIV